MNVSAPTILIVDDEPHNRRLLAVLLRPEGYHTESVASGAEEFLTKPVDRTELWLRVRNLLRLKAYGDLQEHSFVPVSYTHLTLPTIYSV